MTDTGPVCVVLAVCNGAAHLQEQLESLKGQSRQPRWVLVGDDGSQDQSTDIIQEFFETWPECSLRIVSGPRQGYAANFMALLAQVPPQAEFVSLCDQDDVWLSDKLERAVKTLGAFDDRPALYGAATWIWDAGRDSKRLSRRSNLALGFQHAAAQNFAGGNTMVLNRKALDEIRFALPCIGAIPVHDWWLYQLVSGVGGAVTYDETPVLMYRQHAENLIGANDGLVAKVRRSVEMIRGTYRHWNTANLAALQACSDQLSPDAAQLVERLLHLRDQGLVKRLRIFKEGLVKRHSVTGQVGLFVSLLLNKF